MNNRTVDLDQEAARNLSVNDWVEYLGRVYRVEVVEIADVIISDSDGAEKRVGAAQVARLSPEARPIEKSGIEYDNERRDFVAQMEGKEDE